MRIPVGSARSNAFVQFGAVLGVVAGVLWAAPSFVIGGVTLWAVNRGHRKYLTRFTGRHVLYFRSFDDQGANAEYYHSIAPVLSCFGDAMAVLARCDVRKNAFDEVLDTLSGSDSMIGSFESTEQSWKEEIREGIRSAQFVVVDVSTLSESVVWELETTVRELGADRLLVIADNALAFRDMPACAAAAHRLLRTAPHFRSALADAMIARLGRPSMIESVALDAALAGKRSPTWYGPLILSRLGKLALDGLGLLPPRSSQRPP